MRATHLVTGVGGQDGILLARQLRARGDRVVGAIRPGGHRARLPYLKDIEVIEHDVRDLDSFGHLLEQVRPDVIHNLAAFSSVQSSWNDPGVVQAVNHGAVEGMISVLMAHRSSSPAFVQASTSEIFGPVEGRVAREGTPLNPQSPYAEAKAGAHLAVVAARKRGIRATNLVLFGHTSPLHDLRFVLPSLARQAAEVRLGRRPDIELQDPSVCRDWGSAVDFVRAFVAAGNAEPGDFVIATGVTHALTEVAAWALGGSGAAYSGACRSGEPSRQRDISGHRGDFTRASGVLGWCPTTPLRTTIEQMVEVYVRRLESRAEENVSYLDVLGEP